MLAVRQRVASVAQRSRLATISPRQATRSYASDHGHGNHHDHHAAHQVEESPGLAFYFALGAMGFSAFVYSVSRDRNSSLSKWIDSLTSESVKNWEQRNTLRNDIREQAARDRLLFTSGEKAEGFELRTPELIDSGSPHNVPAGHYINLDQVVEHYRKQHLDEEARKAKALALSKSK